VLLAKTLRSTTFKLALVCIAIFGALVFALLGYVYWSTTSFVRSRSDYAITAELAILRKAYARAGRSGLTTTIAQRLVDQRFAGSVYLLADASFAPLAGNLVDWPLAIKGSGGWGNFSARETNYCCGRRSRHFRTVAICWLEKTSTTSMSSRTKSKRPWPCVSC
jgi:hypothetical protein